MKANKLMPGAMFPDIQLTTPDGNIIEPGKPQNGSGWTLMVVYRGKHCPLCTRYLNELETLKDGFEQAGVEIIAVSADSQDQATAHMESLSVSFPVACGLTVEQMQTLGLYISHPRSDNETDHPFAEPGLFVINENGQLLITDISNGPFVRPELNVLLSGITFIRKPENDYPIRGTYE